MTRLEHGVALGSSLACPRSGVGAAGRWVIEPDPIS
jgi:hypothetical protein